MVQARSPTSVVTTGMWDAGGGAACVAGRVNEVCGGATGASGGLGIGMVIFMVCADRPRAAKRAAPDAKARWRKVRRLLILTPRRISCGRTKGWSTNATLPLPGKAGEGVYTRRAVISGEESVL